MYYYKLIISSYVYNHDNDTLIRQQSTNLGDACSPDVHLQVAEVHTRCVDDIVRVLLQEEANVQAVELAT